MLGTVASLATTKMTSAAAVQWRVTEDDKSQSKSQLDIIKHINCADRRLCCCTHPFLQNSTVHLGSSSWYCHSPLDWFGHARKWLCRFHQLHSCDILRRARWYGFGSFHCQVDCVSIAVGLDCLIPEIELDRMMKLTWHQPSSLAAPPPKECHKSTWLPWLQSTEFPGIPESLPPSVRYYSLLLLCSDKAGLVIAHTLFAVQNSQSNASVTGCFSGAAVGKCLYGIEERAFKAIASGNWSLLILKICNSSLFKQFQNQNLDRVCLTNTRRSEWFGGAGFNMTKISSYLSAYLSLLNIDHTLNRHDILVGLNPFSPW